MTRMRPIRRMTKSPGAFTVSVAIDLKQISAFFKV